MSEFLWYCALGYLGQYQFINQLNQRPLREKAYYLYL